MKHTTQEESVNKSPAFQFYVQDFLMGCRYFNTEETGAYILLLCEQWDIGYVENNDEHLRAVSGISVKKLQKVLKKFRSTDQGLVNTRLEKERAKQVDFREKARQAGKKGATAKWGKDGDPMAHPMATPSKNDGDSMALQSSSSTSSSDNIEAKASSGDKPPELGKLFKELGREEAEAYGNIRKDLPTITSFIKTLRPTIIHPYVDLWNLFAGKYDKSVVAKVNKDRIAKLKSRLQNKDFDLIEILAKAKDSDILKEKSWFSFDWILKNDTNYVKVLEGQYDNDNQKGKQESTGVFDESKFNL